MGAGRRKGMVTTNQLVDDGAELGCVGDIAAIDHVQERDIEVGGGHHAETDLAKIVAFLLVVAALRDGTVGKGVDVSVEIGGIIEQAVEIELELGDKMSSEIVFDGE